MVFELIPIRVWVLYIGFALKRVILNIANYVIMNSDDDGMLD